MSQLRDRMIEDLRLRGRADNTINTYVPCVSRFFEWAGVTPNKVDAGIVRAFLLRHWAVLSFVADLVRRKVRRTSSTRRCL